MAALRDPESLRYMPRFVLGFLGLLGGLAVLVLAGVAWRLASLPAERFSDVLAQYNALSTAMQLAMALAVALATIFYAFKTSELVAHTRRESEARGRWEVDRAVGELIGACLSVAAASGGLQVLQKRSWRWLVPGATAQRERFALPLVAQLQAGLVMCARQAEEVAHLRPRLRDQADELVDLAMAAHDAAVRGDSRRLEPSVAGIRPAADRLREASGAPPGARDQARGYART